MKHLIKMTQDLSYRWYVYMRNKVKKVRTSNVLFLWNFVELSRLLISYEKNVYFVNLMACV